MSVLETPVSPQEVHETLRQHMLVDGYPFVLDLARSHGVYLHDSRAERDILDLFGCFSTIPLGYNHPGFHDADLERDLLLAAINRPSNSDLYTEQMAAFVTTFARTLPVAFRRHLFFIGGGAMAVENAMKCAFDWKVQKNLAAGRGEIGGKILHFREAFHGRSGYTLSVTNTDPKKTRYFPKFDWPRVSNPKLRFPVDQEVIADVEQRERLAEQEILSAVERHGHDIAALLIEPIQGEGGDNHFRPEFLATLRRLADEHEMLLIFDEVQTGFGTTGKWWALEHFGVEPDVIAFGKKSQVCGIAANSRVDDVDSVFKISSRINSTWGGNLVDMIRSRRTIEIIEENDLLGNVTRVGREIVTALQAMATEFDNKVTNVRGRGFFIAFDVADSATRKKALESMLQYNVLALASGERSVRMRPPLILGSTDAREGLARVQRALEHVL